MSMIMMKQQRDNDERREEMKLLKDKLNMQMNMHWAQVEQQLLFMNMMMMHKIGGNRKCDGNTKDGKKGSGDNEEENVFY